MATLYDFTTRNIENEEYALSGLNGIIVLFVNIISKRGYNDKELIDPENFYLKVTRTKTLLLLAYHVTNSEPYWLLPKNKSLSIVISIIELLFL